MFEDLQPEPDWEQKYHELEGILKNNDEIIKDQHDEIYSTDKKLRKYSRYVDVCKRFSDRVEKELGKDKYDKLCEEVLKEYRKEISFDLGALDDEE